MALDWVFCVSIHLLEQHLINQLNDDSFLACDKWYIYAGNVSDDPCYCKPKEKKHQFRRLDYYAVFYTLYSFSKKKKWGLDYK